MLKSFLCMNCIKFPCDALMVFVPVWRAWSFQCRQLHMKNTIKYGFLNYTGVNHESPRVILFISLEAHKRPLEANEPYRKLTQFIFFSRMSECTDLVTRKFLKFYLRAHINNWKLILYWGDVLNFPQYSWKGAN